MIFKLILTLNLIGFAGHPGPISGALTLEGFNSKLQCDLFAEEVVDLIGEEFTDKAVTWTCEPHDK